MKMYSEGQLETLFDALEYFNKEDPQVVKKIINKKSNAKINEFKKLYDQLKDMHKKENKDKYKGVKSKTKGELLEKMIGLITFNTKLFDLFENVTNDTNEYDIIITPSDYLRHAYNAYSNIFFQPIVCECKNYSKKVDVTWIGKLYMLLSMSDIKIGIIFSYDTITGEGSWTAGCGLIRKIFLRDKIAIINICKDDYEKIYNNEKRFDEILEEKYNDLKFITNMEKCKRKHNSYENAQKVIDKIKNELEVLNNLKTV